MHEVWEQIRLGWYGYKGWAGQEGGWKAANCSKLVAHAIGEMNKWGKDSEKVLSGTMGALVVPSSFDKDDISRADDVEDGVIDEIFQEGSKDLLRDVDATGDAEVQ